MKYALFTFIAVCSLSSFEASARTINSFRDSDAITGIAQFMYDVSEDMPSSYRLTDKKINIKDFSKCTTVGADAVLDDVESSIKKVLRYYPDEDVPFEQAIVDLEDYLDHAKFKKCQFEKKNAQSKVLSTYYVDASDKIHLRVDNVLLTAE
nr:hypothetical protein BHI3_23620 [Bacteriovorax sp. HI3]